MKKEKIIKTYGLRDSVAAYLYFTNPKGGLEEYKKRLRGLDGLCTPEELSKCKRYLRDVTGVGMVES